MIDQGIGGNQLELKPAERLREAADRPKSAGNLTNLFSPRKERITKNIHSCDWIVTCPSFYNSLKMM
jgi:hypothetical protein